MDIPLADFSGLSVLTRPVFSDFRGYFSRVYCDSWLGDESLIKQANISITKEVGCIRGMHFQLSPCAERKLVTCLAGKVYDVVVDLRRNSDSFGKYFCLELSADNALSLDIPEGFAHGFQCLEKNSVLLYFHTSSYSPEHERGIHPFDKQLQIEWPLECKSISERDSVLPSLNQLLETL